MVLTQENGEVLVTAGAVNALAAIVAAIAEEGDEILIPDPGWPNYVAMIELARAAPVRYRLEPEQGYRPDLAAVEARITPRTKAIIINNPSNPTGGVFDEATVRGLVELARKHDLWLISDEVYEDLIFAGEHVPAARFDSERVITISGVSKSYAMTGWRIGYAAGPVHLIKAMGTIQSQSTSNPCSVAQYAALEALMPDFSRLSLAIETLASFELECLYPRLLALEGEFAQRAATRFRQDIEAIRDAKATTAKESAIVDAERGESGVSHCLPIHRTERRRSGNGVLKQSGEEIHGRLDAS